ncbi:MAG: hypothetical protein ACOH2J_09140 [Allorhizobium sp.]
MPDIDAEALERRQALAEQKQIKLREGEEAMAEHLAGLDHERQKTERLRAARLAAEAGELAAAAKAKRSKKSAAKAK